MAGITKLEMIEDLIISGYTEKTKSALMRMKIEDIKNIYFTNKEKTMAKAAVKETKVINETETAAPVANVETPAETEPIAAQTVTVNGPAECTPEQGGNFTVGSLQEKQIEIISGGSGVTEAKVYEIKPYFVIYPKDMTHCSLGRQTAQKDAKPATPGAPAVEEVKDKDGNVVTKAVAAIPATEAVPEKLEASEVYVKCRSLEVAEQTIARLQAAGYAISDNALIFKAKGYYLFSFTCTAPSGSPKGTAMKMWRAALRDVKDKNGYNKDGLAILAAQQKEAAKKLAAEKKAADKKAADAAKAKEAEKKAKETPAPGEPSPKEIADTENDAWPDEFAE